MLYALSTCGWCRKTKQLLDELGVEYNYEYVDKLQGEEREEAMRKIKAWNPSCSFPTVVLDDEKCIVGYREDEIREALEK
jgi:glutaredoxin